MSVAILLSTYNGSSFVREQLDSLFCQSLSPIYIFVRDDGSCDDTVEILHEYDVRFIKSDDNLGARDSFIFLLRYALLNCDAEYFMFCDQDDIWHSNKVELSLNRMNDMEKLYGDVPLLVHTDLEVVDEFGTIISNSFWSYEYIVPSANQFNRLLVQNTVTGCTVMINRALAALSSEKLNGAIMHDWWLAMVASCFGHIGYISVPTISYRQHRNNTIGAKKFAFKFFRALFDCVVSIFKHDHSYIDQFHVNIIQARSFLLTYQNLLDLERRSVLLKFLDLPFQNRLMRKYTVVRYGFWRQGLFRNISLFCRL